ncbi:HIT domain-containing protein [Planctomicrobium piriforme]|uniref:Diadenosine tetraphosphate (Ap4A) hydrolase n=1 Tax=Planctomicrobium piriforme TaxID=1576369 RepID=A0A1I3CE76_9PLAN|nr:HIT family protein [Planctomicrobium piriforme]SFH72703.1 Diadenosine tetraphosphate (Ap4A) hydrolase [Planctomicrobium piriforme]
MELHPQLLADCHHLGRFPNCHVLLHRNAVVPWLILVPETTVSDLLDLPAEQLNSVMAEAAVCAQLMKQTFGLAKINFAALGNVVPQLHLHVIGRHSGDNCWPKPVWGNLTATASYSTERVRELAEELSKLGGPSGFQVQRETN